MLQALASGSRVFSMRCLKVAFWCMQRDRDCCILAVMESPNVRNLGISHFFFATYRSKSGEPDISETLDQF